MARSGLSEELIKKMVAEYLDTNIDFEEKRKYNEVVCRNPTLQASVIKTNDTIKGLMKSDDGYDLLLKLQGHTIKLAKESLARGTKLHLSDQSVTSGINRLLKKHKISIDLNSPEYMKLYDEFLKAYIKTETVLLEHLKGNYDTDYDIEKRSRRSFKSLSELIIQYEKSKRDNWADPSRTQCAHRQILHILGDINLNEIDGNTSILLIESLKHYPCKLHRSVMHRPWQELSLKYTKRLSEKTQHFIKTAYCTLVNYAKNQELGIVGDPTDGVVGRKPVSKNAHKPFSIDELKLLVSELNLVDKVKNPELYWVPLLLLYSGARSNEICMLRCDDIELVNDIWSIRFKNIPEHHQRTKNGMDRQAPLHNQLIKLGFIDYLHRQKSLKKDRLFDNLKLSAHKKMKWNVDFGKVFNRTFKPKFLVGYTAEQLKEKTLHSFRKTIINWFIQREDYSNVRNISILQSIIGHYEENEISFLLQFISGAKLTLETYGGGYGQLSVQNNLLQMLDYEIHFGQP